jgi:hypothetical protein
MMWVPVVWLLLLDEEVWARVDTDDVLPEEEGDDD